MHGAVNADGDGNEVGKEHGHQRQCHGGDDVGFDNGGNRHGHGKGIAEVAAEDNVAEPAPVLDKEGLVQGILLPQLGDHDRIHGFARRRQAANVTCQEISGGKGDNVKHRQGDQNNCDAHNQQFSGYEFNHFIISVFDLPGLCPVARCPLFSDGRQPTGAAGRRGIVGITPG